MGITSSTSANAFQGQSQYAAQLQQVITTAVNRASAPISGLQAQQTALTNQQSELGTVSSLFASLQTSIDSLNSSTAANSLAATVDDTSVASASASSGALAGTYSITVGGIGSETSTISPAGSPVVTDPTTGNISSGSSFTLTAGTQTYTIKPSGTSLDSLAQAINASGAAVQATVVNVGGSTPDYRLSVQSTQYGPQAVQLSAGATSLLNTLSLGSYVTYQVNGQPSTPINSTSRSLNISSGLTVNVLAAGTANITVAQSPAKTESALTSFVTAYNNTVDELAKNRGQNGGALTGDSTVLELQSDLQSLANYTSTGTGTISTLADIGLTFDENGHLAFDSATFDQAFSTSPSDVNNFLGGAATGGFLQSADGILTQAADPITGLLAQDTKSVDNSIQSLTTQINSDELQVTQLQTSLTKQMSAADATIAALESQTSQMTLLFSDMQTQSQAISNG